MPQDIAKGTNTMLKITPLVALEVDKYGFVSAYVSEHSTLATKDNLEFNDYVLS